MTLIYLASPVTLFSGFHATCASLLDSFLSPEPVNYRSNERVEDRLQEPLVDPQQDRNHNAGNAHHGCGSVDSPKG